MRSSYAFTRPVANSYLVRERDRRLLRELVLVLLVVLCLGGGLLEVIEQLEGLIRNPSLEEPI